MYYENWFAIILVLLLQKSVCERRSNRTSINDFSRRLCAAGFRSSLNITIEGITFTKIDKVANNLAVECDVVIQFENDGSPSPLNCPGACHPTPVVKLTLKDFDDAVNNEKMINATCSMPSYEMLRGEFLGIALDEHRASKIFEIIYYRRIMECREKQDWPAYIPSRLRGLRLRINGGLFIWVGTNEEMETLYLQRSVLYNYQIKGTVTPVSWLATEDVYPCYTNQSTVCQGGHLVRSDNNSNADVIYLPFMPPTGNV